MKKKITIFLLLILANALPIYAMNSSKGICEGQPSEESSSGVGTHFSDYSDSDSDSDDEPSMPVLGDESDYDEGSSAPDVQVLHDYGKCGIESVAGERSSADYLDLAVPFGINADEIVLPSEERTWCLSAPDSLRKALLPISGGEDEATVSRSGFGGGELRASLTMPPPGDIDALPPLPKSKSIGSVDPEYFGQGLPEGLAESISKKVDKLFLPDDGHTASETPDLPSEGDAVAPASGGTDGQGSESASLAATAVVNKSVDPNSVPELPSDSCWYEREFNAAVREANCTLSLCEGIVNVTGNTVVVGDLHGDLTTFREIVGFISRKLESNEIHCVVFLGDIMDRGNHSALTFLELVQFFNKYKGKVCIVRGNHETRDMFLSHDAACKAARNDPLFRHVDKNLLFDFFDNLPYAAIINGTTLAVHGGVPFEGNWKSFRERKKHKELEPDFPSSAIYESMWADYAKHFNFESSEAYICFSPLRGGNTLYFNLFAAQKFLSFMGLKYMIRGHQPDLGTFDQSEDKTITTVFSALENQGFAINRAGAKIAVIFGKMAPQLYATISEAC